MTKEELLTKKVALVTLGCDKNRVDAERMLYFLKDFGFTFCDDMYESEIVIVNTCAFIQSSRTESINKILDIKYNSKKLEKLIVTGCLPQKNLEDLKNNFNEVDLFLPLKENKFIVKHILNLYEIDEEFLPHFCNLNRIVSTPKNYAYLKIADGCDNFCSYCTIPFIRGRYNSVPMDNLILEAKELVKSGVTEIILIAQDVTKYGYDLYKEYKIVELIRKLSEIENLKWIRLLYCYPELISDSLINEIDNNPKVCKYIDIPLQHISDRILKLMNRKGDKKRIEEVIKKFRNCKNYISIRSTFIIGFPSETRKDFNEIKQFLKEFKLNNVGFFAYSKEEGTKAYKMKKQIFKFIKKMRLNAIQKLQKNVILKCNDEFVGKTVEAVLEEINDTCLIFRSQYNSPEIDSIIIVENQNQNLHIGDYKNIKIIASVDIDLIGEIVWN